MVVHFGVPLIFGFLMVLLPCLCCLPDHGILANVCMLPFSALVVLSVLRYVRSRATARLLLILAFVPTILSTVVAIVIPLVALLELLQGD